MPKTEPRADKVEKVADLAAQIEASQALLLADYRGLTVAETKEFRTMLEDADARFSVVKNTLMKRAAEDAGAGEITALLTGPTAVTFVDGDPVLAAKRIDEAAKKFPALILKGGYMEGKVLTDADAKALAKLESREVMLSKIAGLAKGEMSKAAHMFQALQSKFLSLAEALKDKLPAEGAAAPAEEAASEEAPAEAASEEAPAADAPAEEASADEASTDENADADAAPAETTEGDE